MKVLLKGLTGEERLDLTEEDARRLLLTVPVGIFETDLEGHIHYINEEAAQIAGFNSPEEVEEASSLVFYKNPEDRRRIFEHVTRGEVLRHHEITIVTRHGEERDVMLSAWISDGRLHGTIVDITERKRAERELAASEQLNRRIIEAVPGGVVVVSADGSVLHGNTEGLRLLGLSFDDLTRRYVADFAPETLREDGTPCPVEEYPVSVCLATGQPAGPRTIGVRHPAGSSYWAVFTALPLEEPSGGHGAVVTFLDITERKRLEAQMQHAQKLESLGVLAGGIAHDFNNLLAVIMGNASLALGQADEGAPAREDLQSILAATERAADLTRQMLAYAGKAQRLVESVDLSQLVEQMTHLLRSAIPRRVDLLYEFGPELPPIDGDRAQLQQVVMNLITNAADAIPGREGRVDVRIGVCDAVPAGGTDRASPGKHVCLEVTDNGVGMDEHTRTRIFDPFFSTKTAGRGLGLAATLGIVHGHGGAIHVKTRLGRGSSFAVYLPASERAVAGPPPSSPELPRAGHTVLVIDDENSVRAMCASLLSESGFTVLVAEGGRRGIEMFEKHVDEIDAVLLDMTMPDLNGPEVLAVLRRIQPDVRVVLTSGYSEENAARHLAEGRCAFLQKPFRMDQLVERLLGTIEPRKRSEET